MIKKYGVIGLVVLAALALAAWSAWFSPSPRKGEPAGPAPRSGSAALASYVNDRGQEWSIPKGEYDFSVASADAYPKFVIGFISPLDVKVGETQRMMIAVDGDAPLARVWAEVETDRRTQIVEMRLDATSTVSSEDFLKQKYIVDKGGKLVVNEGDPGWKRAAENVVQSAHARGMPVLQYTYVGEWTVADTHTKTYHTKFIAADASGRSDSMTLAWSDPVCTFDGNGSLLQTCTPGSGDVIGADKAMSLGPNTVTLNIGSVLAFPPGASLSLGTSGKLVLSGGSIQKKYLCMDDADNDGFIDRANATSSALSACSGSQKRLVNVYYTSGAPKQAKVGGTAVAAQITFREERPFASTFSFLGDMVRRAFAVGPCPGNSLCSPPPPQEVWSNAANAAGSPDAALATSGPIGNPDTSQYLQVYNYGFTLPSTPTSTAEAIDIKITVRAKVSGGSVNMAVFAGDTLSTSTMVGVPATVSATALTDYVFESRPPKSTHLAGEINNSNFFRAYLQVYDGTGGPTVSVDSATMEISYIMVPVIDQDPNFGSSYGSGNGTFNNGHTSAQCTSAGGTPYGSNDPSNSAGGVPICRFGAAIPGGWTAYLNWSQTSPYTCSGAYGYRGSPPIASLVPKIYAACTPTSCTTGSHTWSNTTQETCPYMDATCTTPTPTCYATYTSQAAY